MHPFAMEKAHDGLFLHIFSTQWNILIKGLFVIFI